MKVQITSDNRELILRIIQDRLGQEAEYHTLPIFSYTVGPYTLTREGCIEAASDDSGLVKVFASLGMCDYPFEEPAPAEDSFTRSTKDISSGTMMNLISIVSARQLLLNHALGRRNAFFVSKPLMRDLLNHPPTTIPEFLQALYSRDDEYKGIVFTLSYVSFIALLVNRQNLFSKMHEIPFPNFVAITVLRILFFDVLFATISLKA